MATKCWGKLGFEMEDVESSINGSSTFQKTEVLLLPEMSNGSDFYLKLGSDSFYF